MTLRPLDLRFQWSGLKAPLPDNVHLLTLEEWNLPAAVPILYREILIRVEHIYEKDEDEDLSKPVTFDLVSFKLLVNNRLIGEGKLVFTFL